MTGTIETPSKASAEQIIAALNNLALDAETQTALDFEKIFPAVAAAKSKGFSDAQLLKLLASQGSGMHHAKFRKLFKAEMKARHENGERFTCGCCGQSLPMSEAAERDRAIQR